MKLGLQLGYWGAQPPTNHAELVAAAEEAGFDTVFTAEAWGSDAYTPLAWWGRETTRMRLGTSVVQLSARTPTACAMAALTLDHLSGGRHILGLGVSGPQVVEGWYGAKFPKPLARTREYIDILRQVWAREAPVTSRRPALPAAAVRRGHHRTGQGAQADHPSAAGRHPDHAGCGGSEERRAGRRDLRRLAADLLQPAVGRRCTTSGSTRVSRARVRVVSREDFEICATAQVVVTDDRPAIMELMKPHLALYMGGMGAEDTNFHADVYRRMGYADVVDEVTALFRTDRKDEAAKVIPDELVDDSAIVGDIDYVRKQIVAWEAAGVTMMVVGARSVEQIKDLADLV